MRRRGVHTSGSYTSSSCWLSTINGSVYTISSVYQPAMSSSAEESWYLEQSAAEVCGTKHILRQFHSSQGKNSRNKNASFGSKGYRKYCAWIWQICVSLVSCESVWKFCKCRLEVSRCYHLETWLIRIYVLLPLVAYLSRLFLTSISPLPIESVPSKESIKNHVKWWFIFRQLFFFSELLITQMKVIELTS